MAAMAPTELSARPPSSRRSPSRVSFHEARASNEGSTAGAHGEEGPGSLLVSAQATSRGSSPSMTVADPADAAAAHSGRSVERPPRASASRTASVSSASRPSATSPDKQKNKKRKGARTGSERTPAPPSPPHLPSGASSTSASRRDAGGAAKASSTAPASTDPPVDGGAGSRGAMVRRSITEEALRSINYSAINSANTKPKARQKKLFTEFLSAHQRGADKIAQECTAEREGMETRFIAESFLPHKRELQRMAAYTSALRNSCRWKLDHAVSLCSGAADGVEQLISALHRAGFDLCESTGALCFLDASGSAVHPCAPLQAAVPPPPPPRQPTALVDETGSSTATGGGDSTGASATAIAPGRSSATAFTSSPVGQPHILHRARNGDSFWQECPSHPPTVPIAQADVGSGLAIRTVFSRALEVPRREVLALSLPPSPPLSALPSEPTDGVRQGPVETTGQPCDAAEVAYQAARTEESQQLNTKLHELTEATVRLLEQFKQRDHTQRDTIAALQMQLDAYATRQKLADDVLHGCLEQQSTEATAAMARVAALEVELRARMDVVNASVAQTLDDLVSRSVELSYDAVYDRATETLRGEHRDSELMHFATRMERGAVEQAAIMRDAQLAVQKLWQTASRAHPGREERTTLLHHAALPTEYAQMLVECDRDTLLRLVHHLSLQSAETARCLASALQERALFLEEHPQEAAAAREQAAQQAAVTGLLTKLYEESVLHASAPQLRCSVRTADGTHLASLEDAAKPPLSQVIVELVDRYNDVVQFEEKLARAAARQREELASARDTSPRPAFFDRTAPLDGRRANGAGGGLAPVSGTPTRSLGACTGSVGETLTYLKSPNPSMTVRRSAGGVQGSSCVPDYASVSAVGLGAWGNDRGTRAARPEPAVAKLFSTGAAATPLPGPRSSRAAVPLGRLTTAAPSPPGIPPRKQLIAHMLNVCDDRLPTTGRIAVAATDGARVQPQPPAAPPAPTRDFDSHDLPYLEKQRAVLRSLLGADALL